MLRYGVLLPICTIVGGFTAAGYLVSQTQGVQAQASQEIAQAAAETLRSVPDPMPPGASASLQAVGERTRVLAGDAATTVAGFAPVGLGEAVASGGPTLMQVAAAETARQLQSLTPVTNTEPAATDPLEIQIAGKSLSNWLNTLSGPNAEPVPAPTPTVAASEPAPAQTEVAALPAPEVPAPDAAVIPDKIIKIVPPAAVPEPAPVAPAPVAEVPAPAPAPVVEAPAPVAELPAPAPEAVAPKETEVAQATGPDAAAPADAAAEKEKAGSVADSFNQRFNDLMKSITGSEAQPDDPAATAKSTPEAAPGAAPAETAGAPAAPSSAEPAPVVAEAASDLVFSDLSYVANADDGGVITLSGRGLPGRKLELYLNDKTIGSAVVAENGRWLLDVTKPLPVGNHQARADLLGADGKVTHSALYSFMRQVASAAGGESSIVPLAKMATAPAEPVKTAQAEPDASATKVAPPSTEVAATPAPSDAKPKAVAPAVSVRKLLAHARPQARPRPVRRVTAYRPVGRPKLVVATRVSERRTVVVNLHRGSKLVRVRIPDGVVRASAGHILQPRARHSSVRKAAARRCPRPISHKHHHHKAHHRHHGHHGHHDRNRWHAWHPRDRDDD
jgi:hypothetical protein